MTMDQTVVDAFHREFYYSDFMNPMSQLTWCGITVQKCPFDLWMYQEIIHVIRPRLIIETGTYMGGSALYLADVLQACGIDGRVISIDLTDRGRPPHDRVEYVLGDSISSEVVSLVEHRIDSGEGPVMVVLDSEHFHEHVYWEMVLYGKFVTVGSYMIVEDTNLRHPVQHEHYKNIGPDRAVKKFLKEYENWEVDRSREKLGLTYNPGGYLKKV